MRPKWPKLASLAQKTWTSVFCVFIFVCFLFFCCFFFVFFFLFVFFFFFFLFFFCFSFVSVFIAFKARAIYNPLAVSEVDVMALNDT